MNKEITNYKGWYKWTKLHRIKCPLQKVMKNKELTNSLSNLSIEKWKKSKVPRRESAKQLLDREISQDYKYANLDAKHFSYKS